MRSVLIWASLALAFFIPIVLAAQSPLLQWRDPVYIAAGFAGIFGLGLLLVQPLLAARTLPGLHPRNALRLHRMGGIALIFCVVLHVVGLWVTSPPDVVDVLLFRSPTPFGIWGAVAMWAVFAAAALAILGTARRLPASVWREVHFAVSALAAVATVLHALLIEGAMELSSKIALCAFVFAAVGWLLYRKMQRRRA